MTLAIGSRGHDLIHAHDARCHTLARSSCADAPLVVSRRVAFPVQRRFALEVRTRARYLAVSEFVEEGARCEAASREEKISVVYDGVPVLRSLRHGRSWCSTPIRKRIALAARGRSMRLER